MTFMVEGYTQYAPCNCGITAYGSVFLEEYGESLTNPIQGGVTADLAGSKICECYCCADVDGDGQPDDWVTSCARARLNLTFRVLVGSMYESAMRTEWLPSNALESKRPESE
jgi:hypothetical protein